MASATDKLQWILEFKGRGLSQLRQELKSANTLVKTLSSSVNALNKLTNRKHNIKINTGAANAAIQKLIKTNEKLKSQIDRKHKINIDDVGVRILQGRVATLQKQLTRLSSKKINIRGSMKIDGAGRNFRGSGGGKGVGGKIGGGKGFDGGGGASNFSSMATGALAVGATAAAAFGAMMTSVVDVVSEKENIIRNYTTMLGSAEKAQAEYFKAASFSQKTDLTFKQTAEIQQRLMNAGFRNTKDNKMLDKALYGVGDLAALQPKNQREGFITQFTASLTKTAQSGRLNTRAVNSATLKGVRRTDIYDSIRKQMGLGEKDDVETLISKGKVGANVGIAAIEEAILKKTGKSKLGEYATGAANTTGGIISNLQELPANMIRSMDFDNMPGFKKFKEFIAGLASDFDVFSGKGAGVREILGSIFNGGFELIMGIVDMIKEIAGPIAKNFEPIKAVFRWVGEKLSILKNMFISSFRSISDTVGMGFKAISEVAMSVGEALFNIFKYAIPIGAWLAKTIAQIFIGLKIAYFGIIDWMSDAWDSMIYGLKFAWLYTKNFFLNLGHGFSEFFQGLWKLVKLQLSAGKQQIANAFSGESSFDQTKRELAEEAAKNAKTGNGRIFAAPTKDGNPTKDGKENKDSDKNLIIDSLKGGSGKGGGAGGGGDVVGKFNPVINSMQTAHLLQRTMPALASAMIQAGGNGPLGKPVVAPIDAVRQQNNFNVPVSLNFTINGDNKTDEIAQKVNVELTRIFGRITVNPTPGVL